MDQPTAVITGAGRGIGRAAAIELSQRGYRLALASRGADELEATCQLITARSDSAAGSQPGSAIAVPTEVTHPGQVQRLIDRTVEQFGRIDAIVHCAGMAPVRPIADMETDEWQAVLNVNLSAAFYLCRSAWPHFQRGGGGAVVCVSSLASRDPFAGFAAYGAAKAGLNNFCLSAAREGEPIGVRVHAIAPGAVETSMFRGLMSPDQWPAEKTLAPADVAAVIAQCITGELRYASGEVIYLHKTM